MDPSIEAYCDSHLPALVRLLDETFHIRNPDKLALIRWKYFDEIHAGGTVMSLAMAGGRAVSQYANAPITLSDDARPFPAMVCADMATAPGYRGRGLISKLARDVYSRVVQSDAVLSVGYSNEAGVQVDRSAKGYGYHVVGRFARYLRPLLFALSTPYRLEPVKDFAAVCTYGEGLRIYKSPAYLTWRYLRKPHADYRVFRVSRGGATEGYAVLRAARGRCHLVELTTSPEPDVLRAVQNTALSWGRRALLVYVLDNDYWRESLRGFVRVPSNPRLENYYLTVKPHCDPMPNDWESPARWRLMGGDIV